MVEKREDPESKTDDQLSKNIEVSDGVVIEKHKDLESKTDGQSGKDTEVINGVVIKKRIDPESKSDGRLGKYYNLGRRSTNSKYYIA